MVLTLAYDGTAFAGSQVQPGVRTVQEDLERALAALFGTPERVILAGRTDRGVHAVGQVASCTDRRPDLDLGTTVRAINARLPEDLAVVNARREPEGFHARYDARWREYRYRIWNGGPAPLGQRWTWQRLEPLDVTLMARAGCRLVGEHDFAALAGSGQGVPGSARGQRPRGTVRRVITCHCRTTEPWWGPDDGALIEIQVAADGFLPQMVRNVAGALVEVGRGARPVPWMDELLAARDRRRGPTTAPAHGLTLWRVGYGEELPDGAVAGAGVGHEDGSALSREAASA